MSGILGVFNADGRPVEQSLLERMLAPMRRRGLDRSAVWSSDGAALAAARHEWELRDDFGGAVLVVNEGDLLVAADASLFYRDDLRAKLAGQDVPTGGTSASHLILAAYRAWGAACVEHLEGDYAFILYDRPNRRVFCTRDFVGKRPAYFADLGDTFVVASAIGSILAHPACSPELNLVVVAATAAGLFSSAGRDTSYQAVQTLPAACHLSWQRGVITGPTRHWVPPVFERDGARPLDAAAQELRHLLCGAVGERLASSGTTSVWMSGGWDSTAVFGAGQDVLRGDQGDRRLTPVSMSYPPGDAGREDELISAIASYWNTPVHWLDIKDVPLFDRPAERAVLREEPFAHLYEMWNRAAAGGSGACGARVALDGYGGDQLFLVTECYLADLARRGKWITLAREWNAKRGKGLGLRDFFRWVIQPVLPQPLLNAAAMLRGGRRLQDYLMEQAVPEWFEPDFVRKYGLLERERSTVPRVPGASRAALEAHWWLTSAFPPQVVASVAGFALEAGVELRSPLYDRRVVEFALRRPSWERYHRRETKLLLRRAMRGLLPDHVLAPRRVRTGMTSTYLYRSMQGLYPPLLEDLLRSPLLLAELGVVNPARLRAAACSLHERGSFVVAALAATLQTELWLRARLATQKSRKVRLAHGVLPSRHPGRGLVGPVARTLT